MEAETPDQVNKTSEQTKVSEAVNRADEAAGGEKDVVKEGKKLALEGDFVVDISRNSNENSKEAEKVCRICHFSGDSELVVLGCDCRGELGVAHRDCAEAWFLQKGNRLCEICGKRAKNVRSNNGEEEEESTALEIEWNELRVVAATLDTSQESSRRCKRSFCNLLLGCLLLAFVLPWLLRGIDML